MSGRFNYLWLIVFALFILIPPTATAARIKDIVSIQGVRPNQLFGYGLVIGLDGTGDKTGTQFTLQGLSNMLEHTGIRVKASDMKVKNVAAVIVSATLPPFARIGKKIDVTISSIGDAKSLVGGTLILTPLKGINNKVYAVAQGPLAVGGYKIGGAAGGGVTKNHPTVGRISGGATVEREIPLSLASKKSLVMMLKDPDFNTASAIARVINQHYGKDSASAIDSGTLKFKVPEAFQHRVVDLIAQMGILDVKIGNTAKIIVNERTGTVVIGENVHISSVAVAHGNLSIEIKESQNVSQPGAFAPSGKGAKASQMANGVAISPGGSTVVSPQSNVNVKEKKARLLLLNGGSSIEQLVKALNAIGISPRDLITVLQAIKAAGALQADLEII